MRLLSFSRGGGGEAFDAEWWQNGSNIPIMLQPWKSWVQTRSAHIPPDNVLNTRIPNSFKPSAESGYCNPEKIRIEGNVESDIGSDNVASTQDLKTRQRAHHLGTPWAIDSATIATKSLFSSVTYFPIRLLGSYFLEHKIPLAFYSIWDCSIRRRFLHNHIVITNFNLIRQAEFSFSTGFETAAAIDIHQVLQISSYWESRLDRQHLFFKNLPPFPHVWSIRGRIPWFSSNPIILGV